MVTSSPSTLTWVPAYLLVMTLSPTFTVMVTSFPSTSPPGPTASTSATGLGNLIQSAVDPVSGLSLRLEVSREHKRTRFSYDILYGADVVRRELGCRIAG